MKLEELKQSLYSKDARQRRIAVHGAEACLDVKVIPLLVRTARTDEDAGVRSLAIHELRRIRERLIASVQSIESLTEFRSPQEEHEEADSLVALEASAAAVRHKAVGKIVLDQNEKAVPALLAALRVETEGWVRAEIAWALGQLKASKEAWAPLIRLLEDPVSRARANAVEALWSIKALDFEARVLPLLSDPDRRVRSNVAVAVSIGHWAKAEDVLLQLARSHDRLDRQAALYCTGKLPAHRQSRLLEILTEDSDSSIREQAKKLVTEKP